MDKNETHILQKHLARFLIDEVFNTITEDDILQVERSGHPTKPDVWHYKGNALTQVQVASLRKQAETFAQSDLWKILKDELRWHAHQKGLVKSQTAEDLIASKVLLYLVDVIDSKLNSMSQ